MGDVFLIRERDGCCFVYSLSEGNVWVSTRLPPRQVGKDNNILCRTGRGWVFQDQGLFGRYAKITLTQAATDAIDDPTRPTRGLWRNVDGKESYTLTDIEPVVPIPDPLTSEVCIAYPGCCVRFFGVGNSWRMYVNLLSVPLEDDQVDDILKRCGVVLATLAQRPRTILTIFSDGLHAAVPSIRTVSRFMQFAGPECGMYFYVLCRGHAIVLPSTGLAASSLLSIVRTVQRLMPAPWPETLVPARTEAETFLQSLEGGVDFSERETTTCQNAVSPSEALSPCVLGETSPGAEDLSPPDDARDLASDKTLGATACSDVARSNPEPVRSEAPRARRGWFCCRRRGKGERATKQAGKHVEAEKVREAKEQLADGATTSTLASEVTRHGSQDSPMSSPISSLQLADDGPFSDNQDDYLPAVARDVAEPAVPTGSCWSCGVLGPCSRDAGDAV
eukprot:TRINITY_DN65058_c0_g1_i1.p1 TRINITY_DN65058_c0_g1~~TRINITY_DN65058_c0_g1_i1.p1  ORF type:complete len:456 (+),score=45.97 TRINITY_DN65058_c0_g1_i1:27-1370(+)